MNVGGSFHSIAEDMDTCQLVYIPDRHQLVKKKDGSQFGIQDFVDNSNDSLTVHVQLRNEVERKFKIKLSDVDTYEALLAKIKVGYEKLLEILQKRDSAKQRVDELIKPKAREESHINWEDLVKQEEQYRLCDEIANEYRMKETDASSVDWIEFTETVIQPRILAMNGIAPTPANLHRLRVAAQNTDVFWVKYNRAKQGDLSVGDPVPQDVLLYSPHEQQYMLVHDLATQASAAGRPLVLLAGSQS